jgi:hypothetical protein
LKDIVVLFQPVTDTALTPEAAFGKQTGKEIFRFR